MKIIATFFLLIFIGLQNGGAHDAPEIDDMMQSMVAQSDCIVSAEVVEIGRKIRMEDGVLEFDIRCVVKESFKGKQNIADTLTVRIKELSMSLGGKFRDGDKDSSLYEVDRTLVFFLNPVAGTGLTNDPAYKPVDCILGVMQPSEQLTYYLWMYVPKR